MKQVDEIIYDAICADSGLMTAVGGRVRSTCFEVPLDKEDNTPIPYIIITDDGFTNQHSTKDTVWESSEDSVTVSIEVAAKNPKEVKQLLKKTRKAVETYMVALYEQGAEIPELDQLTSDGLMWDWIKPCYWQRISYFCTTTSDID